MMANNGKHSRKSLTFIADSHSFTRWCEMGEEKIPIFSSPISHQRVGIPTGFLNLGQETITMRFIVVGCAVQVTWNTPALFQGGEVQTSPTSIRSPAKPPKSGAPFSLSWPPFLPTTRTCRAPLFAPSTKVMVSPL